MEERKPGVGGQLNAKGPKCSAAKVTTSAGWRSSRKSRKSEMSALASGCCCRYLVWLRRSSSWRGQSLSQTQDPRAPGSPLGGTSSKEGLGTLRPLSLLGCALQPGTKSDQNWWNFCWGAGKGRENGTPGCSLSSPSDPGTSSIAPCPPPTSGASSQIPAEAQSHLGGREEGCVPPPQNLSWIHRVPKNSQTAGSGKTPGFCPYG